MPESFQLVGIDSSGTFALILCLRKSRFKPVKHLTQSQNKGQGCSLNLDTEFRTQALNIDSLTEVQFS